MRAAEPTRVSVRRWQSALRAESWRIKRLLETTLAVLTLILLAPVWLVGAVAIWSCDRGPVLLRQRRIGRGGRPFVLLKFRTMQVNADSDTQWSVQNDSRITAVGRVLRRTSLDELPQLVNVVRGEMAIVGPRPERPYFVDRFEAEVPGYGDRHRVRPGITGWAQVHGLRGDTSISDRARFDNEYIDRWSLRMDALILARTAVEMVGKMLPHPRQVIARRHRQRALAGQPVENGKPPSPVALDPGGGLPPVATEPGGPAKPAPF